MTWVSQAKNDKSWLILVYHQVTTNSADEYGVTPANLEAELSAIKNSGIAVKTIDQALVTILAQL
jgi:hypothetical protein